MDDEELKIKYGKTGYKNVETMRFLEEEKEKDTLLCECQATCEDWRNEEDDKIKMEMCIGCKYNPTN